MNLSIVEKKLTHYLSHSCDIGAAFLFGSQTSGSARRDSDIDIALLFCEGKTPDADSMLQIEDDLTSLFNQRTDIIVLNNASQIIRMQVLQKGRKVFERDHLAYINFFVRTIKEYDDLKRVRAINEHKILRGRIYG